MAFVRAVVLGVVLSSPAWAEAGLPSSFCTQASCGCGASTCVCGETCQFNQQTCLSSQASFCSSDANCAAGCDSFICEGNVCVRGRRPDSGSALEPDAGHDGVDGGVGASVQPQGCGCSAGGEGLVLALAALVRRRSTTGRQSAR
jgi:hypothetical protein